MKREKIIFTIVSVALIIVSFSIVYFLWKEWISQPEDWLKYGAWSLTHFSIFFCCIIVVFMLINLASFLMVSVAMKNFEKQDKKRLMRWQVIGLGSGILSDIIFFAFVILKEEANSLYRSEDEKMLLFIIISFIFTTIIGIIVGLIKRVKIPFLEIN